MKWSVGWGPVPYCNMNCEFCYSRSVRESEVSPYGLTEWKHFVDNNHSVIGSINYGTGENTLSDEWFRLVSYIREQYPDIKQALTTNGYLSAQVKSCTMYDDIFRSSIDEVDVSLDFADPIRHNQFRGQKNAYKWATETIEYCDSIGKSCTIVFLGTDEVMEIDNVAGLFHIAENNNAILRTNIYRPTQGISDFSRKYIASYEKIVDLLYWIYENHHIISISDPLFCAILLDNIQEQDHSGIDSVRILHDGYITPSTYLISEEFKLGSITQEGLREFKFPSHVIPDECHGCPYLERCLGGVMDRRYLWYKTFKERDPYCPFRLGKEVPLKKITLSSPKSFHSVHYGYLPTMFFAP